MKGDKSLEPYTIYAFCDEKLHLEAKNWLLTH